MPSYGKRCIRCQFYFVASTIEEKMCPWCKRVEAGVPGSELYILPDDIQAD